MRNQMALVNDDQINMAYFLGFVPDRLYACKRNRFAKFFLAQPGTVDAHRRIGPVLAHLVGVLLN